MIDEKKLIEEIRKRRDYWESKAAEYDEAGERYEYLMDVCDGKATELTATLSIINEQPKVAEWIPCSERPPEYTSNYLVTVMIGSPFGAYKEVRSAIYNTKTGWCVYESADEIANVIAWAESPEPWKGEE